mgnify:CR=1 FL=1
MKLSKRVLLKLKNKNKKLNLQKFKHLKRESLRGLVKGTSQRPRLSVYRSNENIYAQIIDEGGGSDVTCNCAFWGGNNDCRADNGGRSCKTTTAQDENCRTNDSNCGD